MSQAKVDRYKEQKKNRKKIMKKEKCRIVLGRTIGVLVCAAIVGWAGWSVYKLYESKKPASYTEVNMKAITDFYTNMGEN